MTWLWRLLKSIVQPFELGGVTMLIRSAVKNWRSGKFFFKFFNDTISWEEHETIFSGLRISEMTLSNQIIRLKMLWLKFVQKDFTELACGRIQLILPWNGLQGTELYSCRKEGFHSRYHMVKMFGFAISGQEHQIILRIRDKRINQKNGRFAICGQADLGNRLADLWLRNQHRNFGICGLQQVLQA